MSFEIFKEDNVLLMDFQLDEAIYMAETKLEILSYTDFHRIIGRNLFHLKQNVEKFLNAFYTKISSYYRKTGKWVLSPGLFNSNNREDRVKAIYCEMNKFTVNTEMWFIDLYSYTKSGSMNNLKWFEDFDFYSENSLTISGFEDIQSFYKEYNIHKNRKDKNSIEASKICELLIILRVQEVFVEAFKSLELAQNHPVFFTAYDSDIILTTIKENEHLKINLLKNEKRGGICTPGKYWYFG